MFPLIGALLVNPRSHVGNDAAFFAQVTVDAESGTVVWPGGIDLAPEPLYERAHAHPLVAA